MIIGSFVMVLAFVAGLFFSFERSGKKLESLVAELTPAQILVDGVVVTGGAVELRTSAVASAVHKIWLECNAPSGFARWTATANVAHRVSTSGAGYREASPEAGATREPPIRSAKTARV